MGKDNNNDRRKFIKTGIGLGMASIVGAKLTALASVDEKKETVKVLTQDGKLVEVDKKAMADPSTLPAKGDLARQGIPGRKFVMVVDLARCANARSCIEACQRGHDLLPNQEFMQVMLKKDHEESEPYWFPKPCYHCGNPPCVKVCPVGATFKRTDGIVLVDADTCIGCKFCVSACPYSARVFNWEDRESYEENTDEYSPETSVPGQVGTVSKCDFCPDRSREGKLPYCAESCPMGAIYFGDVNEDTIFNGQETLRLKETISNRAGYQAMAHLGTDPNVIYLPPVNKSHSFERGLKDLDEDLKDWYLNQVKNEKP
jgi:Fe-S-cluster-containing dehydrogenase component